MSLPQRPTLPCPQLERNLDVFPLRSLKEAPDWHTSNPVRAVLPVQSALGGRGVLVAQRHKLVGLQNYLFSSGEDKIAECFHHQPLPWVQSALGHWKVRGSAFKGLKGRFWAMWAMVILAPSSLSGLYRWTLSCLPIIHPFLLPPQGNLTAFSQTSAPTSLNVNLLHKL